MSMGIDAVQGWGERTRTVHASFLVRLNWEIYDAELAI